jgi:hypothetical protein
MTWRSASAFDALDGRRLARAIRAEQPEDFSGMDAEAQPVHRGGGAVALEELLDLDGRLAFVRSAGAGCMAVRFAEDGIYRRSSRARRDSALNLHPYFLSSIFFIGIQ